MRAGKDKLRADAREGQITNWKRGGRYAVLEPFADGMRALMNDWDLLYNKGGLAASMTRHAVERCIEDHVLAHGRLPTGLQRIHGLGADPPRPRSFDFDHLVRTAAIVRAARPREYLLSGDERVLFFWQAVEEVASQASIVPLSSLDGDEVKSRRDWLREFLWAYVQAYERMPSGRHRVDFGQFFHYRARIDLGEIDFDQFGEVAGLSPGACPAEDHARLDRNRDARYVGSISERYVRLTDKMFRIRAGSDRRERICVDWYVENYVIEHGRLPIGRHLIPLYRWDGSVDKELSEQRFEVDFDAMISDAAVQYPPQKHKQSKHLRPYHPGHFPGLEGEQLLSLFRRHIDALAAQIDEDVLTSAQGWSWPRCRWLAFFLELCVLNFERMPRGILRADFTPFECLDDSEACPEWAVDLGEIDFDALRRAAGVPDDAETALMAVSGPAM